MKFTKKAFTLIEMIIASVILGIVLTVIFQIYFSMLKLRTDIYAKSVLVKNTNNIIEKLNIIMKNYTIDYEEYFNRRIVGCNSPGGNNFSWNVGTGGYCKRFTTYGNGNSVVSNTGNNQLYYCSSKGAGRPNPIETIGGTTDCQGNQNTGSAYIYHQSSTNLQNGSGCWQNEVGSYGRIQSFGEYKLQFWDVAGNADDYMGCQGDADDTDLGIGPVAIGDNTHVKELYLISKDGKHRIFIRRKLIATGDWNKNGNINYTGGEALYKLQILKLRGFDIGSGHKAGSTGPTVNDGKIDTWACDKSQGFVCTGPSIGGGYVGYNLPANVNDGWADLTTDNITITNFNLSIFPTKSPNYDWYQTGIQISPYIIVNLKTNFYPVNYLGKINPEELVKYNMDLQTTFSIKPY